MGGPRIPTAAEIKQAFDEATAAAAAGTAKDPKLALGLEEGYSPPRARYVQPRGHGRPGDNPVQPLYYSRDIVSPNSWPQSQRMEWQLQMVQAGLLDKSKVTLGIWDAETQKAYQQVLENANLTGKTKEESLADIAEGMAASMAAGFGPQGAGAPIIQLTNAGDLRESFRKTYNERVGKNPSEAAMSAFVDRFHALEAGAQRTYNDAAPGSTVTAAPSQGVVADELIKQNNGADEQAYQTIQRMNDFFGMLGSPVK